MSTPERIFRLDRIGAREVLTLAWPVMVSMSSYTLMSVADAIFVGRLGTAQLAGVGLAFVAIHMGYSLWNGLLRGARVATSHATGAEQDADARRFGWQAIWFAVAGGILIALLEPVGPVLFRALGASSAVAIEANAYFSPRVLASPVAFLQIGLGAWFQGRGDTRTPMVATVFGNLVNVLLDPLLIFGIGPLPSLGVAGASWATAISIAASTSLLSWRYLRVALRGHPWTTEWWPRRRLLGEVWRLGLPLGVQYSLEVAAWTLFSSILARAGDAQLAAHVLAIRIVLVSFLPGYAIGEAGGILVGQSLGARKPVLAWQAWWWSTWLAVGIMVVGGVAFVTVPHLLISVFGAEPEVAAIAADLLLVAAAFQVFDAVAAVSIGALAGAGDTRFTLVLSATTAWVVKLPVGYGLAMVVGMGAVGAWLGLTVEIAVVAALGVWRIAHLGWHRRPADLAPAAEIAVLAK